MKEYPFKDQNFTSWVLLSRTRDAVSRNREKDLKGHDISARQVCVLNVLAVLGNRVTPAEISK